ncbi:MAG: enoyl-CoA hydratase-related protein [Cytophagales bacterium]|nr:enoyl-CoA hydratase-related protein [Bernardetiaceae bacterium]MDW8205267.1 enoyl-CoA hydratase-related protein [Cytophagales bacterium]
MHAHLLISQEGAVKTLTFNLPEKKNPITPEMLQGLHQALHTSETDGTRVIILTGAGEDFSAGADLSAGAADPRHANVTEYLRTAVNPVILKMRQTNIPILAKVRGVCVGVGFNFALACDLIYADEKAVFSQIFTRIGLASDGGGAFFLPRLTGYHKAFELMVTGAMIKAEDALRMGIVNQVFTGDLLDTAVQKMAHQLANGPYVAIQKMKANLRVGMESTLEATLDAEAVNQYDCFQTHDFQEGVSAFLQKRKANFKGV